MNKDLKQLELARIALESGTAMVKVANSSDKVYILSKVNMGIVAEILGNPNKEFVETVMDFPDLPEGEKWHNPNNVPLSRIPAGMRPFTETEFYRNIYAGYGSYLTKQGIYLISLISTEYPIVARIGTFQPKIKSE